MTEEQASYEISKLGGRLFKAGTGNWTVCTADSRGGMDQFHELMMQIELWNARFSDTPEGALRKFKLAIAGVFQ